MSVRNLKLDSRSYTISKPTMYEIRNKGITRMSSQSSLKTYRKRSLEFIDSERKQKPDLRPRYLFWDTKYKKQTQFLPEKIADEVLNDDLIYFLAFCCLVYFSRALFISYITIKSVNEKDSFDTTYDSIESLFAISCLFTAFTGFIFCWIMILPFVYPFGVSLFISTIFICYKLYIQAINEYPELKDKDEKGKKMVLYKIVMEVMFLITNLVIAICAQLLYRQIEERNYINLEVPDEVRIGDDLYVKVRIVSQNQTTTHYELRNELKDNDKDKDKTIDTNIKDINQKDINQKVINLKNINQKDFNQKDINQKDINQKDINQKNINQKDDKQKDIKQKDIIQNKNIKQ